MMLNLKFKALTHLQMFVDLSRLERGIYGRVIPHLYKEEETIESIAEIFKRGHAFTLTGSFYENLAKCELTEVTLTFDSETKGEQEVFDVYKNIRTEENYSSLLKSGMFWEFHPELSGDWEQDCLVIFKKD